MKVKHTCVKKTTSAEGREKELQNFQDLFLSDKDCTIPPISTKSQSSFSTVVSLISASTRRLFLPICIKFDS